MAASLQEQLEVVKELVLPAGEVLLDNLGHVGRVDIKRATELVTDLDGRVEDQLLSGLQRYFPGDAVLAEESGDRAGTSQRTWYIDPLDGTTNYAHGHPFFSISVACADADHLLLGVVYAPYLDELYVASRGGGAELIRPAHGSIAKLSPRAEVTVERALLATGFPYVRDELVDRNTGLVGDFLKARCHGVRRGGSAAVDLVHVAAGKLDGYWEFSLRPWDTAAGTLVAREAGALVTDMEGQAARIHYQNIVAAAPGLHQEMIAVIGCSGEPTAEQNPKGTGS